MDWGYIPDRSELGAEVARFDPEIAIERAFLPPASWYTDPRFPALERGAVFGRSWLAAARADQLREPGAYVSGCIAGIPWVVARGRDGVLRGFHNSCRHKGREVVTGGGVAPDDALVCGYHAWTYALDGRLKTAPRVAGIEDFDRQTMSLVPLAVETWGPWVFIHADAGASASPLGPRLGELERRLVERGWAGYRYLESTEWTIQANWKIVVDNYLDGGYHVPHMHPTLAAQIDMQGYRTELHDDYSIQHAPPARRSDERLSYDPRERIGEGAIYAWVYPNFMINLYGPCIDTNTVIPLAHDRCKVIYDFFFAEDEGEAAQRFVRESIAQSAITQREDGEICESVQIGLPSPSYDRGRYAPRVEMGEHHFHRLLAAGYRAQLGLS